MIDIISDISALLDEARGWTPSYYKLGYTKNLSYSDPFNIPYESGSKNWDVSATMGWRVLEGKYNNELEFISLKASPELMTSNERDAQIVGAMRRILGIDSLMTTLINELLTVRGKAVSYSFHRNYPFSQNTYLYFGAGLGLYSIVCFQGFRSNAEDLLGVMKNVKIGVMHRLFSKIDVYVGYNYRKASWKFKSDEIFDEDGNSVLYELEDFDFLTHGLEIGMRFSVS